MVSDWTRDKDGMWQLRNVLSFQLSGQQHDTKLSLKSSTEQLVRENHPHNPMQACAHCGQMYKSTAISKNGLTEKQVDSLVAICANEANWIKETKWVAKLKEKKPITKQSILKKASPEKDKPKE